MRAYLERSVVVQLLVHRWLRAATCDTSSSPRTKSTLEASFVPATSTRLRYSASSSRGPLSRRPRGVGVYFTTPGISRANADDAAAVMGLMWVGCECVACEWPERPEEEDARRKGSKCSLRRSNSRESGAESSNLCNCAARNASTESPFGQNRAHQQGPLASRKLRRPPQNPICKNCSRGRRGVRRPRPGCQIDFSHHPRPMDPRIRLKACFDSKGT